MHYLSNISNNLVVVIVSILSFSEALPATSFYKISSVLTKKCSLTDRAEAFKNIFFPKKIRIFPSPNSILRFPYLTNKVATGHVYVIVLQYIFALMEIQNQNVVESLNNMVIDIKQTVQSLTTVSVVNNTRHQAQNRYKGEKIFSKSHNASFSHCGKSAVELLNCLLVGATYMVY